VSPKFQKLSALKFVGRTIQSQYMDWEQSRTAEGMIPPQLAAELGSRACPGVHTRDYAFFLDKIKTNMYALVKPMLQIDKTNIKI